MNNYSNVTEAETIRELSQDELDHVNGGWLPVAIAIGGIMLAAYAQGYREGSDRARRHNETGR